MKVIIIGAGFTGTELAKRLISEGQDVVLIDKDEETIRHASNRLDCMLLQANGNNLKVLEEVGIETADFLVALTESDELNMISCSLVDSVYPQVVKIARVRNSDYYNDIGIQTKKNAEKNRRPPYGIDFMIQPDLEAAEAIVNAIKWDTVSESIDFEGSDYQIASVLVKKDSALDGLAIQNLKSITKKQFLAVYIENEKTAYIPNGEAIFQAGDRIGFLTKDEDVESLLQLAGEEKKTIRKIAILGAGRIGNRVAGRLMQAKKKRFFSHVFSVPQKLRKEFAIIEKDGQLAKNAAELFPEATVYKADISDEGFIEEEGLQNYDVLIASTHNHELNIVTAAYLKSIGDIKTVCLVTNAQYAKIANGIGIDVAIPIKDVVIDAIMSHLRGKSISRIHTLFEGEMEIAELSVLKDSPFYGKNLKDLSAEAAFLVLLIKKEKELLYHIPTGDTKLFAQDSLIVLYDREKNKEFMQGFGVKQ